MCVCVCVVNWQDVKKWSLPIRSTCLIDMIELCFVVCVCVCVFVFRFGLVRLLCCVVLCCVLKYKMMMMMMMFFCVCVCVLETKTERAGFRIDYIILFWSWWWWWKGDDRWVVTVSVLLLFRWFFVLFVCLVSFHFWRWWMLTVILRFNIFSNFKERRLMRSLRHTTIV